MISVAVLWSVVELSCLRRVENRYGDGARSKKATSKAVRPNSPIRGGESHEAMGQNRSVT
jgi:hypothetical protein